MSSKKPLKLHRLGTLATVLALVTSGSSLSSCSSGNSDSSGGGSVKSTRINLSIPNTDNSDQTIDASLYTLDAYVNQRQITFSPNDDMSQWVGNFDLPASTAVPLLVKWYYDNLLVARLDQMIDPVGNDYTISLRASDYQTTGAMFDQDADGKSNLLEIINNNNPSDPLNIDVIIPEAIDGAPGINGITGSVWANINANDWRGQSLRIDNLIVDQGIDQDTRSSEFYWKATHNRQKLFLIVYAEHVSKETPQGDSIDVRDDDTLHIFIDGDNSKGESYDGVNDFHIRIPMYELVTPADAPIESVALLDENNHLIRNEQGEIKIEFNGEAIFWPANDVQANDSDNPDSRIEKSDQSAPLPNSMRFATGRSTDDQHVYEIAINLDDLGITLEDSFGLELQLDDDIKRTTASTQQDSEN